MDIWMLNLEEELYLDENENEFSVLYETAAAEDIKNITC